MTTSSLYIQGQTWEIGAEADFSLTDYENEIVSARSGKIYSKTKPKPKMVTISEILANPDEIPAIIEFLRSCEASTTYFTATLVVGENCSKPVEHIFTNCLISGDPKYNVYEKTVDGFEFAYENQKINQ